MLFTCSQTLWSGLRSSFTKWGTAPAFTTACKTTMSVSRWRAWSLVQKFYKSVFSGTPCTIQAYSTICATLPTSPNYHTGHRSLVDLLLRYHLPWRQWRWEIWGNILSGLIDWWFFQTHLLSYLPHDTSKSNYENTFPTNYFLAVKKNDIGWDFNFIENIYISLTKIAHQFLKAYQASLEYLMQKSVI